MGIGSTITKGIIKGLTALSDFTANNADYFVGVVEKNYNNNPSDENAERLQRAYEFRAKSQVYQEQRRNGYFDNNY